MEQTRKGLNIAIFGGMGSGKTTYIKNTVLQLGKKCFIYDPNEEPAYIDVINHYPGRMNGPEFTAFVNQKSRNAINIFEEATPIFRHATNDPNLLEILTRKRHYRQINVIVFHAVNALPTNIFYYLDFGVVFKTTDRRDLLEKKYAGFPQLIEAVDRVKLKPDYQPEIIKFK